LIIWNIKICNVEGNTKSQLYDAGLLCIVDSIVSVISSSIQILEFGWGTFLKAFEYSVEGCDTGEAGSHCNLCNGKIRIKKKILCFLHSSLV
jgi:hypothetical protein